MTEASRTADEGDERSHDVEAGVRDLLAHADIVDVRPSKIAAEIVADGPLPIATAAFDSQIEYALGEGRFRNRFTYAFRFDGVNGEPVSTMEFVVIVEWNVDPNFVPVDGAAERVAATTGYFAAFPYLRELAQAMTARLGMDPFVLGILNRGELKPGGVSVVVRPENRGADTTSQDDQETSSHES